MPAVQELHYLYKLKLFKLTREENLLLEADLFMRICEQLEALYKENAKNFVSLIKFTHKTETDMFNENLIRCIINDIISSKEYTLEGIAYYSDAPEEVIYEILVGRNTSPSLTLSRRIIELHRTIRPSLYKELITKIVNEEAA